MFFKYGGQSLDIRQPVTHDSTYTLMFCACTALVTATANNVVALALQQGVFSFVTEVPCLYAFREPGCALWRLAQSASAKAGTFQQHPVVNNCHLVLCQLPLILVEGRLEGDASASVPLVFVPFILMSSQPFGALPLRWSTVSSLFVRHTPPVPRVNMITLPLSLTTSISKNMAFRRMPLFSMKQNNLTLTPA